MIDNQKTTGTVWQLVIPALLVSLVPVHAVAADEQMTEQLLACDEIADPTERLSCLDTVLESLKSESSQSAPPSEAQLADVPAAEVAPDPAPTATPQVVAAPAESAQPAATPPVAGEEKGLIETVEVPSVSRSDEQYRGEEKTKTDGHARIPFHATIVSVKTHYDGRFSVKLDNGETWRETQGTRVRTPRAGRSVRVYEGTLGGLRMEIDGVPQTAWVRRID